MGGNGPGDGRLQVARRLRASAAHEWMRTLKLGWVLHRKFKNGLFEENK